MRLLASLTLLISVCWFSLAHAQLRIVNYNVAGINNASALTTVLGAIKDEVVNGVSKPIDVLVLNEVESPDIVTILGILNSHGAGTYLAVHLGSTTGGGSVGMIYRANTSRRSIYTMGEAEQAMATAGVQSLLSSY